MRARRTLHLSCWTSPWGISPVSWPLPVLLPTVTLKDTLPPVPTMQLSKSILLGPPRWGCQWLFKAFHVFPSFFKDNRLGLLGFESVFKDWSACSRLFCSFLQLLLHCCFAKAPMGSWERLDIASLLLACAEKAMWKHTTAESKVSKESILKPHLVCSA